MSVLVRDATREDIPGVLAIYNHAVAHTTASWDLEPVSLEERLLRFDRSQAAGDALVVAEVDGRVLGYAGYGPFREKAGYAGTREHTVYVDADARGRGLGRALLAAVIDHARQAGLHALIGGIDATNQVSLDLHRSFGFVEVGRLPEVGRKFDRWLDLAFLELILDRPAPQPAGFVAENSSGRQLP